MTEKTRFLAGIIGGTAAGLVVSAGLVGCDQRQPSGEAAKNAMPGASKVELAIGDAKKEMPPAAVDEPLMAPAASPGHAANDEGVAHAQQSHWDVAEGHFRKALEADPKLAEAQYNLALALDKLNKHDDATAAFKKAAEMAPGNASITDSAILKKHTGS